MCYRLCMRRLLNNCIYETSYLLILIAKNTTACELQQLSKKTNKQRNNEQTKIYILSLKTQLED